MYKAYVIDERFAQILRTQHTMFSESPIIDGILGCKADCLHTIRNQEHKDTVLTDDEVNIIEKNTIDLENVVWENILVEKPMRYTKSEDE